jgi:hypothetical protein
MLKEVHDKTYSNLLFLAGFDTSDTRLLRLVSLGRYLQVIFLFFNRSIS